MYTFWYFLRTNFHNRLDRILNYAKQAITSIPISFKIQYSCNMITNCMKHIFLPLVKRFFVVTWVNVIVLFNIHYSTIGSQRKTFIPKKRVTCRKSSESSSVFYRNKLCCFSRFSERRVSHIICNMYDHLSKCPP